MGGDSGVRPVGDRVAGGWVHGLVAGVLLAMAAPAAAFTYPAVPTKWAAGGPGAFEVFQAVPPNGPHGPGRVSYSFMPAGLPVVDVARDPDHGQWPSYPLASLLQPFADDALERAVLGLALALWAQAAGGQGPVDNLTLSTVVDGNAGAGDPLRGGDGDIRIGVYRFTDPIGESQQPEMDRLAHAFQPGTRGFGSTIFGDTHFRCRLNNDAESDLFCPNGVDWVLDPNPQAGQVDLFSVALHEIGHALGLGHSAAAGSVMQARYTGARQQLGADDIAGIRALYTPVPEPTPLALLAVGLLGLAALRRRAGAAEENRDGRRP